MTGSSHGNYNNTITQYSSYAKLKADVDIGRIADGAYSVGGQFYSVYKNTIIAIPIIDAQLADVIGFESFPVSFQASYTGNSLYFDPTATNSDGSGTSLANPFTTADQLNTYINNRSGSMTNRWLFFKRGTIVREPIQINVYGSAQQPFFIMPYGDENLPMPVITSCQVSSGWQKTSGYPGIWEMLDDDVQVILDTTGCSRIRDYFQYYNKSSLSNLQAAGPGWQCYTGGKTYIYPRFGQNPNDGSIEKTSGTDSLGNIYIKYKDIAGGAAAGNIHIMGIQTYGHRADGISLKQENVGASLTSISNISVVGCEVGFVGADKSGLVGTSDGIVVYGSSNTKRASNVHVTNNIIYNTMNNSVEFSYVDGGTEKNVESAWNIAWNINAKTVIELYSACSNVRIHHNIGRGNRQMVFAPSGASQNSVGVWIPGFNDGGVTYSAADNVGIDVDFNYCSWIGGNAVLAGPCTVRFRNNTFLGGGNGGSAAACVDIGNNGVTTAEFTNNIMEQEFWGSSSRNAATIMFRSRNAGDVVSGNNNYLASDWGDTLITHFRGTAYTADATGIGNFKTAIAAITAGAFTNLYQLRSFTTPSGRPLPATRAAQLGTTAPTGYGVDLASYPLTNTLIGAMAPAQQYRQVL